MNHPSTPATIEAWHQLVQSSDAAALARLLADDVVFESPVVLSLIHISEPTRPY